MEHSGSGPPGGQTETHEHPDLQNKLACFYIFEVEHYSTEIQARYDHLVAHLLHIVMNNYVDFPQELYCLLC